MVQVWEKKKIPQVIPMSVTMRTSLSLFLSLVKVQTYGTAFGLAQMSSGKRGA